MVGFFEGNSAVFLLFIIVLFLIFFEDGKGHVKN